MAAANAAVAYLVFTGQLRWRGAWTHPRFAPPSRAGPAARAAADAPQPAPSACRTTSPRDARSRPDARRRRGRGDPTHAADLVDAVLVAAQPSVGGSRSASWCAASTSCARVPR
ncbi:hypothetical protein FTX61_14835 [Nitriliruptoraceae bacterium ZYF776]|nr:hypothetical protein [Profundirhabdus halotolerans]